MLRSHGGYRRLRSFQVAEIVYDATVIFCDRFINPRSRTHDQMVQAARSGRQNIAEGSRASGTSSQIELRLVGVARASLDELLLDYEDFLRQRRLALWDKNDARSREVRAIGRREQDQTHRADASNWSDQSSLPPATPIDPYRDSVERGDPEMAANTIICLIHQANYLLDQQLRTLERQFIEGGGYSEQLAAARRKHRTDSTHQTDRTDQFGRTNQSASSPTCPKCGYEMAIRTARKGPRAGSQFWGCQNYPECKGTLPKST
jgi:four helix bundle suffix protein